MIIFTPKTVKLGPGCFIIEGCDGDNKLFYRVTNQNDRDYYCHNIAGPAIFYPNGEYYDYQINSKYHRLDGPARVWNTNMSQNFRGIKTIEYAKESYYIEGKQMTYNEFKINPQVILFNKLKNAEQFKFAIDLISI